MLGYCWILLLAGFSLCLNTSNNGNDDENYKALKTLHAELDDDHDGAVTMVESNEYMNELEIKDSQKEQKQHNMFQEDDNQKISPDELWKKWKRSEVFKWSCEEVIHWLKYSVELPEYAKVFQAHRVNGRMIPRLATPQGSYVQKELKIANTNHRRKIYLRASDLILFGLPVDFKQLNDDKSYLAMKAVHMHLDDDSDGKIDADESKEYMDEELGVLNSEKRHLTLHNNNDNHISMDELWENWLESEVYKWSTDEVVSWLTNVVGLPQYEQKFRERKITGKYIPRIATDKSSFLQTELKIENPKHRRKIYLKASDIILFGPPDVLRSYFNDTLVAVIIVIATIMCVYAFREKNQQRKQIEDMSKDLYSLQQAEDNLKKLQESLVIAEMKHQSFEDENSEREKALLDEIESAKKESERLHHEREKSQEEKIKLALVEKELSEMRLALAKAKLERTSDPKALEQWLQKTYRIESQNFQYQKNLAITQMEEAKEACERVRKTRRSLFGSLKLAHGQSIDLVDQKIVNARSALADVTSQLKERQHRWSKIEELCGFSIANDGLFSNFSRINNKYRKTSLSKALIDVTNLTTLGATVCNHEEEAGSSETSENSLTQATTSINKKKPPLMKEDSFDSSKTTSSSSSINSANLTSSGIPSSAIQQEHVSELSDVPSATPPNRQLEGIATTENSTKNEKIISSNSNSKAQPNVMHRSESENISTHKNRKELHRVATEPCQISEKGNENIIMEKAISAYELNEKHETKSLTSLRSRGVSGFDDIKRGLNDNRISYHYDSNEYIDPGNISDVSEASVSSNVKKTKKKAVSLKKIFHRKSKEDR